MFTQTKKFTSQRIEYSLVTVLYLLLPGVFHQTKNRLLRCVCEIYWHALRGIESRELRIYKEMFQYCTFKQGGK